jgi:hypothetical protein
MTEQGQGFTTWMFQYNPRDYDLEQAIKTSLIEDWRMNQFRSRIRLGERVYFMRSGSQAAITALGRVVSWVHEQPSSGDVERYRVNVVYDATIEPPLTREPEICHDDILKHYRPFATGHFNTNFPLPPHVAERTERLTRGRLRKLPHGVSTADKRIFMSHSRHDNDFALRLAHDLRHSLGDDDNSIWFDSDGGLHGGDAFMERIEQEIRARPIFMVILSPDAITSGWVSDELHMAWSLRNAPLGKDIIPVLYRDCQVPLYISSTIQMIDFTSSDNYKDALLELLTTLGLNW